MYFVLVSRDMPFCIVRYILYWYPETCCFLLLPPANEVWGKVIFSEACVKKSVHGGVCLSACWDTTPRPGTHTPQDQAPPGPDTPGDQASPRDHASPRDQAPPRAEHAGRYKRAVRILLECNVIRCILKVSRYMPFC